MSSFVFLFRSSPESYRSLSPEQMQQALQKWIQWREKLEKDGHIKAAGQRLDLTGKVIRGKAKTVTDGPYVEVKDAVQGYMVAEAQDLKHATELAAGCPVLDIDGTVEVRPFFTA